MKSRHWGLLLFLLVGIVKLPVEHRVYQHLSAEEVLPPRMEVGVMENLGQMGLAASLGGLRSMVASGLYLSAASAWDEKDWGSVDNRMGIATATSHHRGRRPRIEPKRGSPKPRDPCPRAHTRGRDAFGHWQIRRGAALT